MADDFQTQFTEAFEAATNETPKQAVQTGFTGVDPAILYTAASALQAYAASPEGKTALANAGTLDPSMLGQLFDGALNSSWFQNLINDLEAINPVKAVSLGVMGEIEVIVGIAGTAGYAMDLSNFGSTSAIYAGGGVVGGVDAGGELSLCLGLWTQTTADIGGRMTGVEADITDTIGLDGVVFGDKDSIEGVKGGTLDDLLGVAKVVFLGIDVGVDDGVEGDEYYFFAGHLQDYPTYQNGPYDYLVMLEDLICVNSQAHLGDHDDVYMLYTVDGNSTQYRYPYQDSMRLDTGSDNDWYCGNMIKFNNSFEITLKVSHADDTNNTWSASDFNQGNGYAKSQDFKTTSAGNTTEYTLNAKLIAQP